MRRLVILLAGLSLACSRPPSSGQVGDEAPVYSAPALNGESVSLAGLRGQVVLLNVWATWCIPCRKELPELQQLHQQLASRGLHVVGVSVDDGSADRAVDQFVREFGLTYTILRDPAEKVSHTFAIPGVPASFLIDRNGKVVWRHLGPVTTGDPLLQSALKQAL
ncbi:MAG: TlpA disulfide reductase family protein [Gemmatimonadota bacterium]